MSVLAHEYAVLGDLRVPPEITMLSLCNTTLNTFIIPPDSKLKIVKLIQCDIQEFPQLPDTVEHLVLRFTEVQLKSLPPHLVTLDVSFTGARFIPALPETLETLWMEGTLVRDVPDIPDALYVLQTSHSHNIPIDFPKSNQPWGYMRDVRTYQRNACKVRHEARMSSLKESLMAAVWHPRRMAKWIELGVDEMMMGL